MSSETVANGSGAAHDSAAKDQMRGAVRFPLRLPVKVFSQDGMISAMTEDISSTGVQFSSDSLIVRGALVRWEICLPASVMGSAGDVSVDCAGRVMWTGDFPPGHRFGVVIDSYLLKENQR